jgi:hypothetical protein
VILVDAGPLVALVDADDQYHWQCVSTLKSFEEPLATVWPPLTEAMHLLNDLPAAQEALWEMLVRRCSCFRLAWSICVASVNLGGNTPAARWILLTQRLSGLPSEKVFAKIFTVDQRDFAVYRIHGRIRPSIIP